MSRWRSEVDRVKRIAGLVAAAVLMFGARALATQAPQEFVPRTEAAAAAETLPALPLLYAAYAVVWVVLVAYVFLLWRRMARVERDLADVTAKLASRR